MLIQVAPVVSPFAVITLSEISALHACNGSELRTYLALALHAGPDGACWPGRRRLAEITGQTKANVSRSTAALAASGLIEKELTPTGRVLYHLPLHRPCPAKAGIGNSHSVGNRPHTPFIRPSHPAIRWTPPAQTLRPQA